MIFPNSLTGDLYKTGTILGAFLAMVCLYSLPGAIDKYDEKLFVAIEHLHSDNESDEKKEFWKGYLASRRSDAFYATTTLLIGATIGLATMVISGVRWYLCSQQYEDEKRILEIKKWRLENEKLEHEIETSTNRQKIKIAS